ncbi:MAG: FAD-binding protein [Actinobacteria bacterium]|nr:FAD-binding protein [Actinomycetota bacterium]
MDLIAPDEMSIGADVALLQEAVRDADRVIPTGARTQWEIGGAPRGGTEVRAPAGVIRYEPADLTVTVGAGTTVEHLSGVLREHGQECPLDPRAARATVGGVLSAGLSGHRRLRYGPLRNWVLEVRFVTADGRIVKGGGPTVKNVSGYDLPRLLVGALGTIGLLTQVTLRAAPLPVASEWATSHRAPGEVRAALLRPASILYNGRSTRVLLEGDPADVASQRRAAALELDDPPGFPPGRHRGRISVTPDRSATIGPALTAVGARWLAEIGVGTVHVAADNPETIAAARDVAHQHHGWLLREAGAPALEPFGVPLPNLALHRRVKAAFDPHGKMNPGRIPAIDPDPAKDVA